jgi:hypothetical protein
MLKFTDEVAPHQIAFEAFGVAARVCSNSREILAQVEPVMPPGWRPCSSEAASERLGILVEKDGTHSVYQGSTRVLEGQMRELSLIVLEGQMRGYVALNSPDKTFIHAGAVARGGHAIIFPGQSFSGKTTLTAAMVRAGAMYLSDEFAVLDEHGRVHPYPKRLSLRSEAGTSQVDTHAHELGGEVADTPLPVGLAVLTSYRAGAEWRPKRLSCGQGALMFLGHAVQARTRPQATMQAIKRALEPALILTGERGEADDLADELLGRVPA